MKEKILDFLNGEKDKNNPNLELNLQEITELLVIMTKATEWDLLDEKVRKYYEHEDSEGDLYNIGEICAIQLGYL